MIALDLNFGNIGLKWQTSSKEIERVCERADESVMETAAISVTPVDGGPEQLVIFVVLNKGYNVQPDHLKTKFSKAIRSSLNPLFKVLFTQNNINLMGMFFWFECDFFFFC